MNNKQLPKLPPPINSQASPERKRRDSPNTDDSKTKPNRKATANRFGVLNEFVDCSLSGLTKTELIIWFTLYRDTRNGTARTSQADIARRGGVSVRAVQYSMRQLIQRGLLQCVYHGGINRGPSRWRVLPTGKKNTQPP